MKKKIAKQAYKNGSEIYNKNKTEKRKFDENKKC